MRSRCRATPASTDIRDLIAAALAPAPGGGTSSRSNRASFRAAALRFVDLRAISGLKVVVDGANGMAGPTIGPILEQLDLEL